MDKTMITSKNMTKKPYSSLDIKNIFKKEKKNLKKKGN
jgi:hypothetical protein